MIKIGRAKSAYMNFKGAKANSPFRVKTGPMWRIGKTYFRKYLTPVHFLREVRRSTKFIVWLNQYSGDLLIERVGYDKNRENREAL